MHHYEFDVGYGGYNGDETDLEVVARVEAGKSFIEVVVGSFMVLK